MATIQKLKQLSKENLQEILQEMMKIFTREQSQKLEVLLDNYLEKPENKEQAVTVPRMSGEYVDEKMREMEEWMRQINEGELYLDTEGYEDYSSGYWDSDWITEYYDNQGIGEKVMSMIQFAGDCVDDKKYGTANSLYEWLWDTCVRADEEYEEPLNLEMLKENDIIQTDMKQVALRTLYAAYQVSEPGRRAENLHLFFSNNVFYEVCIEDMFHAGRENLMEQDQFWEDWIELLKTKSGAVEARLLKEAVLHTKGLEGLLEIAGESCSMHPALYDDVMKEYEKTHDYAKIEKAGMEAIDRIDSHLVIRSKISLRAAYAASCMGHMEKMMEFCWEAFRSDTSVKNFLRLFGTKEMAEMYGMRGKEILNETMRGNSPDCIRNEELRKNILVEHEYYSLRFYMGDFEAVKKISHNPEGSLGWSGGFIRYGIRLFLLYLYENSLPSKAAAAVASYIGFQNMDNNNPGQSLSFERDITEESHRLKISLFWNYFQRWKDYFNMPYEERRRYLDWAEKIVYGRADAIVGGQHRNHYGEVAALLAVVAEIKESMGAKDAKAEIFAVYKGKFPRHSSFQAEMKSYFIMR